MDFILKSKKSILPCLIFLSVFTLFFALVKMTFAFPAPLTSINSESVNYLSSLSFADGGKVLLFVLAMIIPVIIIALSLLQDVSALKKIANFAFIGLAVIQIIILLVVIPLLVKNDAVSALTQNPLISKELAKDSVKVVPAIGAILSAIFNLLVAVYATLLVVKKAN